MNSVGYKQWLESQKYQPSTIAAQMYRAGKVEERYGDLDNHFDTDRLASVIESLVYTMDDRRKNRPNPTKIPFDGDPYKNLASYRDAVKRYLKFRLSGPIQESPGQEVISVSSRQLELMMRLGNGSG